MTKYKEGYPLPHCKHLEQAVATAERQAYDQLKPITSMSSNTDTIVGISPRIVNHLSSTSMARGKSVCQSCGKKVEVYLNTVPIPTAQTLDGEPINVYNVLDCSRTVILGGVPCKNHQE